MDDHDRVPACVEAGMPTVSTSLFGELALPPERFASDQIEAIRALAAQAAAYVTQARSPGTRRAYGVTTRKFDFAHYRIFVSVVRRVITSGLVPV